MKNIFYIFSILIFANTNAFSNDVKLNKNDTTVVKYKEVTFREAEFILKIKAGVLNAKLSRPNMSKVFNLSNGSMLVIGKTCGYIYKSEMDVIRLLNGNGTSENILFNLNYYGTELPKMANDSRLKIAKFLKLDVVRLDFSEQSLDYIDHGLIENYSAKNITDKQLLANAIFFITYSGSVFNMQNNATWLMILDDDGKTWQPYNVRNGEKIDLFNWVFSSLCDLSQDEMPGISAGYEARTKNFLLKGKKTE